MKYTGDSTDNFLVITKDAHVDFIEFLADWIDINKSNECGRKDQDERFVHDTWHLCSRPSFYSNFGCDCKSVQELFLMKKALTSFHGKTTLSNYMSLTNFFTVGTSPCLCCDAYIEQRFDLMYGDEFLVRFETKESVKNGSTVCSVRPLNGKMCLSLFGNRIITNHHKTHSTKEEKSQSQSCHCGLLEINHDEFPALKRLAILKIWRNYKTFKTYIEMWAPKPIQQIFLQ